MAKSTSFLILDVATAALPNVADFLEPADSEKRTPPANYSKPDSIAKWRKEDYESDVAKAGLDLDMARITAVGFAWPDGNAETLLCRDEMEEQMVLFQVAQMIRSTHDLITYNGIDFDIPMLKRRARYLGMDFPAISVDRFKTPIIDVCEFLSDRNPKRRKSLGFFVKRLGWTDLCKPLSGAEEAQVPTTGKWAELEASLHHDVTATFRLAQWLGLIEAPKADAPGFAEVGL